MNLLGILAILSSIAEGAVSVYKKVFGDDQKPTWTTIVSQVIPQVLGLVDTAISVGKISDKAQLDTFLDMVDIKTGLDAGALDILRDVTPQAEEEFFDGLVAMLRAYGYAKLKVEGYYQVAA